MKPLAAQTAKFEQVLFYLDGPQLVTLTAGDKSRIVAVAVDKVARRGFFGGKVSLRQLSDYFNQRFDLRFLISNADRMLWYEFDLPQSLEERITLTEVELTPARTRDLLPSHGIFARDLTEDYHISGVDDRSVQRFDVDGKWDMREFSKFHASVSDLYALTRSIDLFIDEQVDLDRKRKVMTSFIKPWEGGGSYYGFFRSLAKAGGRDYRPDIKAIQWASPGYIDVFGDQESFERLTHLLNHYSKTEKRIIEDYDHLWSYLQETKFLKRSSKGLDRKSDIAREISARAQSLSASLSVTSYRNLKKMAGNDPVVAAKVLLATKRRVERLYRFFQEGRLSVADLSIG